jgi:hypothetical protein
MDTTAQATTAPAPEIQLSRQEKEKLLQKMYTASHWIAIIRLFGYQSIPMDRAREKIKPIAEEFGKELVATACEALVDIKPHDKEPVARLKPHVRRMAFQILGPEPPLEPIPTSNAPSPKGETQPPGTRKPKKSKAPRPAGQEAPPESKPDRTTKASGSPIMEQYRAAKERHPNMLLLFRMGDFYELFGEDAETAHKLLGLTLTTRDRTITMAGFPHHQLETYLHKLLQAGERVAICEPVEDSLARGPIRREVTRVVTPGAIVEEAAPAPGKKRRVGDKSPAEGRSVRQPRHFVLKKFQAWLNEAGLAFVSVDDVKRTTPAAAQFVGVLDFVVMRGDEKLLVTVRPHLQAKHLKAIGELHKLFGADYKPVRMWPIDGPDGWSWLDFSVDDSAPEPA